MTAQVLESSKILGPNESGDPIFQWLANSDRSTPISSNQPSLEIPFQRWFKFKEAFSPQFVVDCAKSLDRFPKSCIDPFGGSGTSALTCQFLNIAPTTIEVNPFLADLISAKLSTYNLEELKIDYLKVLSQANKMLIAPRDFPKNAPEALFEPGYKSRWIYNISSAKRILAIKAAIEQLSSECHRTLLRVVLGSILVTISNVVVNGKGRKYRNGWELRQKTGDDVDRAFREAFLIVYSDLSAFSSKPESRFTLLRGDSRKLIEQTDCVDFAIFSPPYPNSFDYTDIYNLELWILGYLTSASENKNLRNCTLRSHVQLRRDYTVAESSSGKLQSTYKLLCEQRNELWNTTIPEMVLAYFDDMHKVLSELKKKLRRGGKVFLAVGDSKYAGVMINTAAILVELAPSTGYKVSKAQPIRSMRASAQQGGRAELSESLVVLA